MATQIRTAAMGELCMCAMYVRHRKLCRSVRSNHYHRCRCTKLMTPYVEAYVLRLTCCCSRRGLRRTAVGVEALKEVAPPFSALVESLAPVSKLCVAGRVVGPARDEDPVVSDSLRTGLPASTAWGCSIRRRGAPPPGFVVFVSMLRVALFLEAGLHRPGGGALRLLGLGGAAPTEGSGGNCAAGAVSFGLPRRERARRALPAETSSSMVSSSGFFSDSTTS